MSAMRMASSIVDGEHRYNTWRVGAGFSPFMNAGTFTNSGNGLTVTIAQLLCISWS